MVVNIHKQMDFLNSSMNSFYAITVNAATTGVLALLTLDRERKRWNSA